MLTYNTSYQNDNSGLSKRIRWVVEVSFNSDHTDQLFVTSHDDVDTAGMTGVIMRSSLVSSPVLASQKLDIFTTKFSIGAIRVIVQDTDRALSALISERLGSGLGLRNKRIRLYRGFAGLDFNDYITPPGGTQIITGDLAYNQNGSITINAKDVQRDLLGEIFVPKQTVLTSSYVQGDSVIAVNDTSDFQMVEHSVFYSADPGVTIGYIQLGDDDSPNIISYTGIIPGQFTGCVGGRFGTLDVDQPVLAGPIQDGPPVIEHIYLNLPAGLMAETVISNTLSHQVPGHWTAGLGIDQVVIDDFINIGNDIYDPGPVEGGLRLTLNTSTGIKAKQFLEQQVNLPVGAFMPVRSDGRIGYQRMGDILSDASTVASLDSGDVISYSPLNHDLDDVTNTFLIRWSKSVARNRLTRISPFIDAQSISINGLALTRSVSFDLLSGGEVGEGVIHSTFNAQRAFLAGPPQKISVDLFQVHSAIEVGDIVGLSINARDVSTGLDLNRSFMVAGVKDQNNKITLSLIGSSQQPSDISLSQATTVLDPLFYSESAPGVGLPPANNLLAATTSTETGSTLNITGNSTLAGGPEFITYWYDGDVIIDAGVNVGFTDNVEIRARTIVILGTISGSGGGLAGAVGGNNNPGAVGAVGNTESAGGVRVWARGGGGTRAVTNQGVVTQGVWMAGIPPLILSHDGLVISGLPGNLYGTSGGAGGATLRENTSPFVLNGGDGGSGGGGLIIVSRNVTTSGNGIIDVSGGDGMLGTNFMLGIPNPVIPMPERFIIGGSGAGGAPGGVLFVMDGTGGSTANVRALNGFTPRLGIRLSQGYTPRMPDGSGVYRSFWQGSDQIDRPLSHSRTVRLEAAI